MSKIYIVLTYSGTVLSKIVKVYTQKDFSHVSIALDEDLKRMYSFGRLNPYSPFLAGFVQESPKFGTFKRFNKTRAKIYSLEVDERQYEKITRIITKINLDKKHYRFNILGLFAVALNMKIKREKCFYCAEFVKYIFDNSNLKVELPEIIKPTDFENVNGICEVYDGMLSNYKM